MSRDAGVNVSFTDSPSLLQLSTDLDFTLNASTLIGIGGQNLTGVLSVEAAGSILVDGLTLQDCNASEPAMTLTTASGNQDAPAGSVTVLNSIFSGGTSTLSVNSSASALINNSAFSNIVAPSSVTSAVYLSCSSTLRVTASNFTALLSSSWGAVTLRSDSGDLSIDHGMFANNSAQSGGAVCLFGSTATVSESLFDGNSATGVAPSGGLGGAMYLGLTSGNVTECQFQNNTAAYGGAIYTQGLSVNITYCTFESNAASGYSGVNNVTGGAVLFEAPADSLGIQHLHVGNSHFIRNSAEVGGAGVGVTGIIGYVSIDSCDFQYNRFDGVFGAAFAARGGLAAAAPGTNVLLSNVLITDTIGVGNGPTSFGATCTYCTCLGVINSTFTQSNISGLAVYQSFPGTCEGTGPFPTGMFNASSIASSEADTDQITSFLSGAWAITIAVWHSRFSYHNLSSQLQLKLVEEGALVLSPGFHTSAVLVDVLFESNFGNSGPALTTEQSAGTVLWGCTFANNGASRYGAGLFAAKNDVIGYLIGNTTMVNNTAL